MISRSLSISQDSPTRSPKGARLKVALALLITQAALQSCGVINYFEGSTPLTPQTGGDSDISIPISPYDHEGNSGPGAKDISISPVTSLFCSSGEISALDRRSAQTMHSDGWFRSWEIREAGEPRLQSARRVAEEVTFATQSKNGKMIVFGTSRGVKIFETTGAGRILALPDLRTRIVSADFSPDSSLLALGGIDGRIYEVALNADELQSDDALNFADVRRYIGHSTVVNGISFHNSGRIFFSSDWQGDFNAWLDYDATYNDLGEVQRLFGEHVVSGSAIRRKSGTGAPVPVEKQLLSADGQLIFLGLNDGTLQSWRIRGFRQLTAIKAHKGLIYDMALVNHGASLLSVGRDGMMIEWQLVQIPTLPGNPEEFKFQSVRSTALDGVRKICSISNDFVLTADQSGKLQTIAVNQMTQNSDLIKGTM